MTIVVVVAAAAAVTITFRILIYRIIVIVCTVTTMVVAVIIMTVTAVFSVPSSSGCAGYTVSLYRSCIFDNEYAEGCDCDNCGTINRGVIVSFTVVCEVLLF